MKYEEYCRIIFETVEMCIAYAFATSVSDLMWSDGAEFSKTEWFCVSGIFSSVWGETTRQIVTQSHDV